MLVWDPAGKKQPSRLADAAGSCSAYSPDGKSLAVGYAHGKSSIGSICLWDLATRTKHSTFKWHEGGIRSVAFSPDGQTLASGADDKAVKLWDVAGNTLRTTLKDHPAPVVRLRYAPSGKRLLATSSQTGKDTPVDLTWTLWDLPTEKPLTTLKIKYTGVSTLSPDSKSLAMVHDDVVKLYNLADFMEWLK
jgi:WD40 repeat protein